jgi:hypothetical protein
MVLTLRFCVLYGTQNKQRLLPYTSSTEWFCNRDGVFTGRYALNPYMKQIRLVFKGLISTNITYNKAPILHLKSCDSCREHQFVSVQNEPYISLPQ